ncbi:unnamed protein product [Amoebophrya sp. A120]|nr:unnamed protein product [Amoebophrya sp. A120]|eukprot:GSA120T00010119001.1
MFSQVKKTSGLLATVLTAGELPHPGAGLLVLEQEQQEMENTKAPQPPPGIMRVLGKFGPWAMKNIADMKAAIVERQVVEKIKDKYQTFHEDNMEFISSGLLGNENWTGLQPGTIVLGKTTLAGAAQGPVQDAFPNYDVYKVVENNGNVGDAVKFLPVFRHPNPDTNGAAPLVLPTGPPVGEQSPVGDAATPFELPDDMQLFEMPRATSKFRAMVRAKDEKKSGLYWVTVPGDAGEDLTFAPDFTFEQVTASLLFNATKPSANPTMEPYVEREINKQMLVKDQIMAREVGPMAKKLVALFDTCVLSTAMPHGNKLTEALGSRDIVDFQIFPMQADGRLFLPSMEEVQATLSSEQEGQPKVPMMSSWQVAAMVLKQHMPWLPLPGGHQGKGQREASLAMVRKVMALPVAQWQLRAKKTPTQEPQEQGAPAPDEAEAASRSAANAKDPAEEVDSTNAVLVKVGLSLLFEPMVDILDGTAARKCDIQKEKAKGLASKVGRALRLVADGKPEYSLFDLIAEFPNPSSEQPASSGKWFKKSFLQVQQHADGGVIVGAVFIALLWTFLVVLIIVIHYVIANIIFMALAGSEPAMYLGVGILLTVFGITSSIALFYWIILASTVCCGAGLPGVGKVVVVSPPAGFFVPPPPAGLYVGGPVRAMPPAAGVYRRV